MTRINKSTTTKWMIVWIGGIEYLRLSVLAAASLATRFSASHFEYGKFLKNLRKLKKGERVERGEMRECRV